MHRHLLTFSPTLRSVLINHNEDRENMTQQMFKGALNDACLEVAKQVLWTPEGASNDVIETLAAKFQKVALDHVDFIVGQGRDPNIITRAIHYLEVHAIPPMGTDIRWFKFMLNCVIEMAVPNSGLNSKQAEFLKDIQTGIDESIQSEDE